jgi:hypothetical protein
MSDVCPDCGGKPHPARKVGPPTARVPKVGGKGWRVRDYNYPEVDIVAVDRDQVWVRSPTDTYGQILHVKELTPPEPTVTVSCWIGGPPTPKFPAAVMARDDPDTEAKLERLSDGTWRVTNLKDGQQ